MGFDIGRPAPNRCRAARRFAIEQSSRIGSICRVWEDESDMSTPATSSPRPRLRLHSAARIERTLLPLARAGWLILALLVIVLVLTIVPSEFDRLQQTCLGAACVDPHLTPLAADTLARLHLPLAAYAAYFVALELGVALVYLAVGAVIVVRGATERVALLAAIVLTAYAGTLMAGPGALNQLAAGHPIVHRLASAADVVGIVSLGLFLSLFPSGRFRPRWSAALALGWGTLLAPQYLAQGSLLDIEHWPDPIQVPVWLGLLGGMAAIQIYRYRATSNLTQRRQTKWVVLGVSLTLVILAAVILTGSFLAPTAQDSLWPNLLENTCWYLAMTLVPLSVGVAMLRSQLWNVDLIINRTLVYGMLTAGILGLYLIIVTGLGGLFQARGNMLLSTLAAGFVALLIAPLRGGLQRGVNRLMYGERDTPYAVLSRLGQRLEGALPPETALPTIVETVGQALKLPYVAIALEQGESPRVMASYGSPATTTLTLPLVYGTEPVGSLRLSPRAGERDLSSADRRLLEDLARQIVVAVHAVRLTAELQQARERLVTAREEERRRLRRNLHDGLGPQLGSQTLTLSAVRKLLRRDPDTAEALLDSAMTHAQQAITDIRRVVYDLRPSSLDDLGLIGAIREGAARYSHDGLQIQVDAPETLPHLPAAVEVAAYRITLEALTNVTRHAAAGRCTVRLTLAADNVLKLEIEDDGRGLSTEQRAGVGMTSMRERAAELSGVCTIESFPGHGTRVRARLPLSGGHS